MPAGLRSQLYDASRFRAEDPPAPMMDAGGIPSQATFGRGSLARQRARKVQRMRIALDEPSPDPSSEGGDVSILKLGDALTAVALCLDREDAMRFRQTCKTVRSATVIEGFPRLWAEAHEQETKARRHLKALRRHFDALDECGLETVDAGDERNHEWQRVLAPRRPRTPGVRGPSSPLTPTSAALVARFKEVDAHVLSTEVQQSTAMSHWT